MRAEFVEERVEGGGVLARRRPTRLSGGVVGDQGEVLVMLPPADLVDADVDQAVEAVGVQVVGDDAFADPPDGVPVHPGQPYDSSTR